MEMQREFTRLEVGKPFPLAVPEQEGAVMDLWADGLVILVQTSGLSKEKYEAFHKGFERYTYYEFMNPIPIPVWAFDFPDPHGPVICDFNAVEANPGSVKNYLETSEGIKNAVTFFLLDGKILAGIQNVGLDLEAVKLFHKTMLLQLHKFKVPYPKDVYDHFTEVIRQQCSAHDFLERGTQFRNGD